PRTGQIRFATSTSSASRASCAPALAEAEASAPSESPGGAAPPRDLAQPASIKKRCAVQEWQTLSLGPFGPGTVCEITRAWYGIPDGKPSQIVDVTSMVRERWDKERSLRFSGFNGKFNELFGDPAPMSMKTLCVEYTLHSNGMDVSRGNYAEGVFDKIGLLPGVVFKTVSNTVGIVAATGGLAVGKAVKEARQLTGDQSAEVADNAVFQMGWTTWLRCNGIFPSVSYEECASTDKPAEDMRQTPLLVSNHMCYIETFALPAIFNAPKVLGMKGICKTPFIGMFAKEIGLIEVDRDDKASRTATLHAIQSHVEQWTPGGRPLLMFPEGTTGNGDRLLPFRRGAFVPGAPVRPVVLVYTGAWNPANTNFKTLNSGEIELTDDAEWGLEFLGHFMHSLQVRVLRPYVPNEEERADPELYASNVHKLMSEAYAKLRAEVDAKKREETSWQARLNPMNLLTAATEGTAGFLGAHVRPRRSTSARGSEAARSPGRPSATAASSRGEDLPSGQSPEDRQEAPVASVSLDGAPQP
ncbi:unnamed protein product, partial [Prorocentrum cordatum]